MNLTQQQIDLLKELMTNSARKGNLANSGMVFEGEMMIASAESWVVSNHDATAHSERMLVEQVCKSKKANYTPGLIMLSVVEPCTMCMSACSQAGYSQICYIIPASRYVTKIPWMTDGIKINKQELTQNFSEPLELIHLSEYEEEFCGVFEKEMSKHLI
jgi:tRNA(Arg) A34 adenosine deaminase TadA